MYRFFLYKVSYTILYKLNVADLKKNFLFQSCTNSVVLLCIFLKAVQPIKSFTVKEKSCTFFGTLSLALNFNDNCVCAQRYSFFQTCKNSVVLICIFLKSCTTIKKLYNQREKLYIFGTLSLALNFIDNGVCTKMYSFFQTCTNSVVLICIFSKSCTTKEKSCTSLVHCPWLLISLTMVFVPKCTVFSKPVQILWSSYVYFQKAVQTLKSSTTKEKSCASLVPCRWLLISLTMVFVQKCTVFSNLYKFCGPHMYISKKLYNH